MQNTIFINGHAGNVGGGVRYYQNGNLNNSSKIMCFCFFENNTAGTGFDVYLTLGSYDNETGPVESSFSLTSTKEKKLYWEGKGYRNNWLPDGTLNRYVRMNGTDKDEKYCMDEKTPCETFKFAIGFKIDEVLSYVVMMEDFTKEINTTFIFGDKDRIGFKGYDPTKKTPVLTINTIFAEVTGFFDCSFLTLKVKTSIDYLYKIKTSTTFGGTVFWKNIYIKCSY